MSVPAQDWKMTLVQPRDFHSILIARTEIKKDRGNYLCYKVEAGDHSLSNFCIIMFNIIEYLLSATDMSIRDFFT